MLALIVAIFVIGYLLIALEHPLKIDKAASALLAGVLCWTVYVLNIDTLLPESKVPIWYKAFHDNPTATQVEDFSDADHILGDSHADEHGEDHDAHSDENTDDTPEEAEVVSESDSESNSAVVAEDDHSSDASHASNTGHALNLEYLLHGQLNHHLAEIAGILFFLMGAMTIVEIVDAFEGFAIITSRISAVNRVKLLWIVCILTFFMSAVLDNLTSTIVIVSLLKKLVKDKETRLFFAGMAVVSANAGGAWTVIGDVTTTMLWIKGKIGTVTVMKTLLLPSIVCMVVPLVYLSFRLKGNVERPDSLTGALHKSLRPYHQYMFLAIGLTALLFVPVYKAYTHLFPFMGMLLSLGFVWMCAEFVKHDLDEATRSSTHVLEILKRIDSGSILFFLGILLAISCLASTGLLLSLAGQLDAIIQSQTLIALLIGLLSAIVDNVPLVAAGIEMYPYPTDSHFWLFLAYCAGTGGSCLIIGSAAGVAAMGLEKIDFIWYVRRVAPLALLGYLSGAGVYLVQQFIFKFPV